MTMSSKHYIHCEVSGVLKQAIEQRRETTGQTLKEIVVNALRQYLQVDEEALFQTSTIGALVEGVDEGDTTIEELKQHGDFGIGTFDDLDGEMIELEGKFYQIKSDGHAYVVKDSLKTPFATVTFWKPDVTVLLDRPLDYLGLQEYLDSLILTKNMFYAIKIQGSFDYVQARSVPKQPNHTRLAEVATHQPTFEFHNVEGTLAGFWTPPFMQTVNVPGYHLHFITQDRKLGGHLLECRTREVTIGIHHTPEFHMALPETTDFLTADLSKDTSAELNKAEK
jgi:acetolactate decarboxylase